MKLFLAIILFISLAQASPDAPAKEGPIVVGGGAGSSEFSLVFLRANLASIFSECFATTCGLSAEQKRSLDGVLRAAQRPPDAFFYNSQKMGEVLFALHPETNSVWFNQDLLWMDSKKEMPYDSASALSLWTDVLVASSATNVAEARVLDAGLRGLLRTERTGSSLDDGSYFEILLWKSSSGSDRLYVSSPALDMIELTTQMTANLGCENPQNVKIFAPVWVSENHWVEASGRKLSLFNLRFKLRWSCDERTHSAVGTTVIRAQQLQGETYRFEPESIDMNIGEI